jgi:hypothetical protein
MAMRKQHTNNNNPNDEDDFFGNQNSDDDTNALRTDRGLEGAEAFAMAAQFRNLGFHQAYESAKEGSFLEGVESGYRDHYEVSVRIGELLGARCLSMMLSPTLQNDSNDATQTITSDKRYLEVANVIRGHLTTNSNDGKHASLTDLESKVEILCKD